MKTFDLQRGNVEIVNRPMENRKWFILQALDRLKRAENIRTVVKIFGLSWITFSIFKNI